MKTFEYTIKDEQGIHARPAGMLVKEVKKYQSKITVKKGERTVEAQKLMALLSLGVKCADRITVSVDGADEEEAAAQIEEFLKTNL